LGAKMIRIITSNRVIVKYNFEDAVAVYNKFIALKLPVMVIDNDNDVLTPVYLSSADYKVLKLIYEQYMKSYKKLF
jgi:hypothetical protein